MTFSSIIISQVPTSLRKITTLNRFFNAISNHAKKICWENKHLFFSTLSSQEIKKILTTGNITMLSLTKTIPYDELLTIIFTKAHVERQLVKHVVSATNALKLSPTEKAILLATCDLGNAYDEFYLNWRKQIITSSLGKQFQIYKHEAVQYAETKGLKITNPYLYETFTEKADGTLDAVPYAIAFPKSIHKIETISNRLIDELTHIYQQQKSKDNETKQFIIYFQALTKALTTTDNNKLEQYFKEVDMQWMKIKGRLQPIHMMETYADPLHLRVTPEFSLAFLDSRYEAINKQLEQTKKRIITFLKQKMNNNVTLTESLYPINDSQTGVYILFTSGKARISKFVGKNVPNRTDVRLQKGVKIFLNMEGIKSTNNAVKKTTQILFGKKRTDELFSDKNILAIIKAEILTGGHELTHNAFIGNNTRKKLNHYLQLLDEQKADLTTIIATEPYVTLQEKKQLLRLVLTWNVARLKKKSTIASRPYYFLALISLQTMIEAEMLMQNRKNVFTYDESQQKMKVFYKTLRKKYDELITIYESLNAKKAEAFIKKYNDDTTLPTIQAMQKKLGVLN